MTEFKDIQHDIDSCKDVWEGLYKIVYLNFFEKYFDFSNLRDYETSKTCKRWYIKLRNDIEIKKEFPKFKMAGDCIFNFNENKINKLNKYVKNSKEGQVLLEKCAKYHYSFENFAFMPITGGMNNQKGRNALDRPDIHINEIRKHFAKEDSKIFKNLRYNLKALEWYLSIFNGDINKYLKEVYLINDKTFINKFIEFANVEVKDELSAINYMNLALEFWKIRKNNIDNLMKLNSK